MEIGFDRIDLRTLCENPEEANSLLGFTRAELLRDRLSDFVAAATIADLIIVSNVTTSGNEYRYEIDSDWFILFRANNNPLPMENGKLKWHKVSRISIVDIRKADGI